MPCHHALAEALRAYIDAAGIVDDRKGWLFRTARGHNGSTLSDKPMSQPDAWRMICRRAAAAGIAAPIGCHFPRYRDHRLPRQWRRARTRAGNGGTREPADDQALRPHEREADPGRGRENSAMKEKRHVGRGAFGYRRLKSRVAVEEPHCSLTFRTSDEARGSLK
jgi:hypothetical protein